MPDLPNEGARRGRGIANLKPPATNPRLRWPGIQQVSGKQSRNRPLANDVRSLARAIIEMCGYRAYSCLE